MPTQLLVPLVPLLLAYAGQSTLAAANRGASGLDNDLDVTAGLGNGGGDKVYRLREGVERFFITDINNPGASARSQSQIWIQGDNIGEGAKTSIFNHIPGGANYLYLDGHVEFLKYNEKGNAPVNSIVAGLFTFAASNVQ
jgi:prepilin-type processing-associated H-X9-DG protein